MFVRVGVGEVGVADIKCATSQQGGTALPRPSNMQA